MVTNSLGRAESYASIVPFYSAEATRNRNELTRNPRGIVGCQKRDYDGRRVTALSQTPQSAGALLQAPLHFVSDQIDKFQAFSFCKLMWSASAPVWRPRLLVPPVPVSP